MYRSCRHDEQVSFVRSELRKQKWLKGLELLDAPVPGSFETRVRDLVAGLGRGKPVTREAA